MSGEGAGAEGAGDRGRGDEPARSVGGEITAEAVAEAIQRRQVRYDRAGDDHYQTVSAFIKSLRGSDPDAAVFYLAKMLAAGEDPRFIARRMVILASEDVGNADPQALLVATAAAEAVERIGLPEAGLNLAQAATYLATAPKSNRAAKRPLAGPGGDRGRGQHGGAPAPAQRLLRRRPRPGLRPGLPVRPRLTRAAYVPQRHLPEGVDEPLLRARRPGVRARDRRAPAPLADPGTVGPDPRRSGSGGLTRSRAPRRLSAPKARESLYCLSCCTSVPPRASCGSTRRPAP